MGITKKMHSLFEQNTPFLIKNGYPNFRKKRSNVFFCICFKTNSKKTRERKPHIASFSIIILSFYLRKKMTRWPLQLTFPIGNLSDTGDCLTVANLLQKRRHIDLFCAFLGLLFSTVHLSILFYIRYWQKRKGFFLLFSQVSFYLAKAMLTTVSF